MSDTKEIIIKSRRKARSVCADRKPRVASEMWQERQECGLLESNVTYSDVYNKSFLMVCNITSFIS